MKRSFWRVVIFTSTLFLFILSSCAMLEYYTTAGMLEAYVLKGLFLSPVEGVTVVVKSNWGRIRGEGKTDSSGIAKIGTKLIKDGEQLNVIVKKENYGTVVFQDIKFKANDSIQIFPYLEESVATPTYEIPIDIDVRLYTDSTKSKSVDPSSVATDTIYVVVNAKPKEFDIKKIYVKVNGTPGGVLNLPADLSNEYRTNLEGTISLKDLQGEIPLIVVAQDKNNDKVQKVIYLNIVK